MKIYILVKDCVYPINFCNYPKLVLYSLLYNEYRSSTNCVVNFHNYVSIQSTNNKLN